MQLLFILLQLSHVFIVLIGGAKSGLYHESAEQTYNRRFQGRYTRDIRDYEVTIPRRVNPDGTFRSFSLPHFYRRNNEGHRERRDDDDSEENHNVHYALTFNNLVHHLELTPNYGLLSPSLVVERRRNARDLSGVDLQSPRDLQCHYVGTVRGQRRSRVALSNCDGLAGHITTPDGHFFIEPAQDVFPEQDGRHLHLVHRHVRDEYSLHPTAKCGAEDDWQDAWAKRLRYEYGNGSAWKGDFKRSSSEHRFVELCVVADKMFIDHHKSTDPEAYVLTIMNMVSDYYHDASVGNMIDVIVVRIIMLEYERREVDLTISRNAEKTLESFAAWAKKSNPISHNHPNHHDVAVLLTRHDICSNNETQCGLLGLAYVAAACNEDLAACINEDGGLVLSVVVTHEVGHVMGCSHDTEEISGCKAMAPDGSGHVMSPYVKAHTTVWSSCSRKFITEFLDNGLGECLLDQPQDTLFKLPQMPPGAMYDATYQCRTYFGPNSKPCSETVDCTTLWCVNKPGSCSSYGDPPAEGTECAAGKWCYNQKCVLKGQRPGAVNGGWGPWSAWSSCSRTCGGGVASKERQCDNPAPKHLGRYCVGKRKTYRTCNTIPCSLTAKPYREVQCTEKNWKPFMGKLHTWKPYTHEGGNPCALTCINEQHTFSVLEPRVKDGTPCKVGTRDMCVGGACKHVGCDWQLESGAEFDQCGICKGDGTQCEHVQGVFVQNGNDYVKVVTIPKGVHNVKAEELKATVNTIAVSAAKGGRFYLNGQHKEEADGQYMFGQSTLGVYSHPEREREDLVIFGPTEEDLILYVVFYSRDRYPGLHYEYFKKKSRRQATSGPKYNWEFLEWGECSVRCGGGTQISQPCCVEDTGGRVSNSFCQELQKQEPISRECNTDQCTSKWVVGKWSQCTSGKRTRDVRCMMEAPHVADDDIEVSEDHCNETKPECSATCTDHHSQDCSTTCTTPCSLTTPCLKDLDEIRSEVMNVIQHLSSVGENLHADVKGKCGQQLSSEGEQQQSGDFKEKLSHQLATADETRPTLGGETKFVNLKDGKDTQQVSIEGTPHHMGLKEYKDNLHSLTGEKHGSDFLEVNDMHALIGGEKHPADLKEDKENMHALVGGEKHSTDLKEEKENMHALVGGEKHPADLKEEKENMHALVGGEKHPADLKDERGNLHSLTEAEKDDMDLKEERDHLYALLGEGSLSTDLNDGKNNVKSLAGDGQEDKDLKQEENISSWLEKKEEPENMKEKDNLNQDIGWFMGVEEPENVKVKDNSPDLKQEDSWLMVVAAPENTRETKSVESVAKGSESQLLNSNGGNDIQQLSLENSVDRVGVKEEQEPLQSLKDGRKRLADFERETDNAYSIVAREKHPADLKEDTDKEHSITAREKHPADLKEDNDKSHSITAREKHPVNLKDNEHSITAREKHPADSKDDKGKEHSIAARDKHQEDKDNLHSFTAGGKQNLHLEGDKDNLKPSVSEEKQHFEFKDDTDNLHSSVAGEKDNLQTPIEKVKHEIELKDNNMKGLDWFMDVDQRPKDSKEIVIPQEPSGSTRKLSFGLKENESAPQVASFSGEKQFTDLKRKKAVGKLSRHHKHRFSGKNSQRLNNLKRTYKQRHSRRGKKRHHGGGRTRSRLSHHQMRHSHWKKPKHGKLDRRVARGGDANEDEDENDNEEDLDVTTKGPCKANKDHKLQQNEEVEDRLPDGAVTLVEVPVVEPNKTCSNVFSDEAEEEMGDPESVMLDTKNEKVYHGKEAVDKIKEIEDAAKKTCEHT